MAASNSLATLRKLSPPAPTSRWSAPCWPAPTRRRAKYFCGRAGGTRALAARGGGGGWRAEGPPRLSCESAIRAHHRRGLARKPRPRRHHYARKPELSRRGIGASTRAALCNGKYKIIGGNNHVAIYKARRARLSSRRRAQGVGFSHRGLPVADARRGPGPAAN